MSRDTNGEKTEKPSSKKKKDARKKGNVSKSHDLISGGTMVVLFAVVKAGIDNFTTGLTEFTGTHLTDAYINTQADLLTIESVSDMFSDTIFKFIMMILPVLVIAMLSGVALNLLQTGFIFAPNRIKPDFNKINPIEGFKRLFSSAALMEMLKSTAKIAIIAFIIYKTFVANIDSFITLAFYKPGQAFLHVLEVCASMGVTIGAALFGFAIADVIYQWWKHQKELRMTKQEVKEENKQMEGDPQIKAKIRQIQRQMSRRRMMKNLQEADVVITNPTHFAVALRYREKDDPAPVVVAKGQDLLAQKIKQVANEHKITIVENKPVARALYASCEIGQVIPVSMYQAIADILVYVYKTTNRMPTH